MSPFAAVDVLNVGLLYRTPTANVTLPGKTRPVFTKPVKPSIFEKGLHKGIRRAASLSTSRKHVLGGLTMIITNLIFEAYLNCPLKCFLLSTNVEGSTDSYDRWVGMENASYRHTLEKRLAAEIPPSECLIHPEAIKNVKAAKWQLVLGVTLRQRNLESDVHAIKRIPSKGRETPNVRFVPIRFSFANKLTKNDKLVLAFDALVLAGSLGIPTSYGEIIHGDGNIVTKVKTSELLKEVRKTVAKMESILPESAGTPPGLFLNRHCTECEYQTRCRQEAIEKDDLTLLAGMTEQERKALAGRGIFTVTQLSYTFRPRRKAKRYQKSREKYHTSLKALSIREQKIHVVGSDALQIEGIPVYLDAEALPDKDFYYLVGLRVGGVQHVLWADSKEHERRIWHDLLAIVSNLVHPVIVHYGAFDAAFLKNMCDRYGSPETESVKESIGNPINLLSFIFARIYFPTYSNGLKDIGRHLGFHWSQKNPSGIKTVMWRSEWERTHEPSLKERLITYNTEDCLALQRVTEFVAAISSPDNESTPNQEIVRADTLPRRSWFKWGKTRYVMPDLGEIGKAAYWDYQQEKIILKSNPRLKETRKVTARPPGAKVKPNKTIRCPAPDACVRCGYPTPYRHY
jgi:predicted RecB family nuclease